MASDPRDDVASFRAEPGAEAEAPTEPEAAPEAEAPAEPEAPRAAAAAKPRRGFFERLRAVGAWIQRTYCVMDPRTAGLYRIVAGFLCTAHMIRHWQDARTFYSNDGVLTNHYHLFRPSSGSNFSIFHAFSSIEEVHVAFALGTLCHLLMMIGWHARLFTALSFILVTSLDNRLVMVENGGYVVVNLVCFYALFLPVDRRFSVDALRRSLRERRERSAGELNDRARPPWATEPFVSVAVLLVVLNLAVVYFFNVVNKSGSVWRTGYTVHYVLHLNRMVTGLAVVARKLLPLWATRVLTWLVLVHEALLVPWILSPSARRLTRWLAIFGIFALHFAFGVMMRLGPFSWFMIGWSSCLLLPEQWDALERWYRRRAEARVVVYDRRSPLAFAIARILARLDGLELLTFEESAPDAPSPALLRACDPAHPERSFADADALREIAQALPGGRYALPVLRLLFLGQLGRLAAFASARRDGVARFLGLVPPEQRARPVVDEPSPLRLSARRVGSRIREAALAYVAICFVIQAWDENKSIPPVLKFTKPRFVDATIGYPRLYQGWGMFAPNPITDDGVLAIDARTIDGRRVDPLTGKEPDLDLTDSEGEGLTQIRQDYANRIRLDRNRVYRQGLQEYLQQWHRRTGRPEDELVAFDVYWVRAQCPKPGESKPSNNENLALLTWRKPGYRPPPGQPPLPPEPKIQSAEGAPNIAQANNPPKK